ncbi:MAG: OmpH family outer membrane protein [Chromatiaceae bacterium]|nr:OmpH family outer membrane protein [Chromatiaceae bacterium]
MRRLILTLPLLLSLPVQALAADLGYVDMQKVLDESRMGQQLQEELRASFESRGRAIAEEEQTIMQQQEQLERDAPLMSEDQVKKRRAELESRIRAYQEEAGALQRELMQAQKEKGRTILVPAREAVESIAKKHKLDMVIERGQIGLLYIDEALDLTAEVIEQLDKAAR